MNFENDIFKKLCSMISGPLKAFLKEITGLELTSKVSISASVYKQSGNDNPMNIF